MSKYWFETFRYDLRDLSSPFVIFFTDLRGKRSEVPPYSYIVLPSKARGWIAKTRGGG